MRTVECIVIGGGPAGLEAARAAASAGAEVVLIDENVQLGGQYFRQPPATYVDRSHARETAEGKALIDAVRASNVEVRLGTVVWAIFDERTVAIASGERSERLRAQTIVIAPGAYDRPVPFPGWTLPGVMTAGGAQNLMKAFGVAPGRRVVIAGSGPLLLVVAHYCYRTGAEVVALCESADIRHGWRTFPALLEHLDFVRQGYGYWREIRRARTPFLSSTVVRRAEGRDAVEGVVTSRCEGSGRPVPGSEQGFAADALVVGYGFLPSTELMRLAGCRLEYRVEMDAWVPERSDDLESTVAGIFVAGDGAGVAGSAVALAEGRLAGLAAAKALGRLSPGKFAEQRTPVARTLARLGRFRHIMDALYAAQPGLYELADAQTTICRCEEIRASEIEEAMDDGARSPAEIKGLTRIGMGRCQGRMCGSALVHMSARRSGTSVEKSGSFSVRAPVKPVSLGAVVADTSDLQRTSEARG